MTKTAPPYPTGDLREWARQLVEFLLNRELVEAEALPTPVLLLHQIPTDSNKAFQDGVLMYDPQLGKVVVSIGGEWKPIQLEP